MLRFDLSEILRTPGMRQVYTLNEPPYPAEDVEFVSPITGRIAVTNTSTLLLVRGAFHTSILLECSRCLAQVIVPISADIEEEFDLKISEDARHREKIIEVVEDEAEPIFEDRILNLGVVIRQAALLDAPLQPLCRVDCPGIPFQAPTVEGEEIPLEISPFRVLAKIWNEPEQSS